MLSAGWSASNAEWSSTARASPHPIPVSPAFTSIWLCRDANWVLLEHKISIQTPARCQAHSTPIKIPLLDVLSPQSTDASLLATSSQLQPSVSRCSHSFSIHNDIINTKHEQQWPEDGSYCRLPHHWWRGSGREGTYRISIIVTIGANTCSFTL